MATASPNKIYSDFALKDTERIFKSLVVKAIERLYGPNYILSMFSPSMGKEIMTTKQRAAEVKRLLLRKNRKSAEELVSMMFACEED